MTPVWIDKLLGARAVHLIGRIVLTFMFWGSGLSILADFSGFAREAEALGFSNGEAVAAATALTQLTGSALIIWGRYVWLGAGALGVFTFLTIPLVHHFWAMPDGPQKITSFHTATEHISMIGALILVSVLMAGREGERTKGA